MSDGKIAALKLLKQARDDAEDTGEDPRQFAVRKEEMFSVSASESDLRWLVKRRYAEQLEEITQRGVRERQFALVVSLTMRENTCYVLSHLGKVYVERNRAALALPAAKRKAVESEAPFAAERDLVEEAQAKRAAKRKPERRRRAAPPSAPVNAHGAALTGADAPCGERMSPDWRPLKGDLYFRGELLRRRGRKTARLVELLLEGFADAKWVASIVNPLGGYDAESYEQLKETVRRLNDGLLVNTIWFHVHLCHGRPIASWEDCVLTRQHALANTPVASPAE